MLIDSDIVLSWSPGSSNYGKR